MFCDTMVLLYNNSVSYLDIKYAWLGPQLGQALGEALEVNTSLTMLNARNNNLGFEGGRAMSQALQVNSTLTSLEISCNFLDPPV